MDLLKQLTNQPQASKSGRPPAPLPGHSSPSVTELAHPFTGTYFRVPLPFDEQFSLLPLRDGLHFRMTCRDLFVPWLTSFQELITLTPFEQSKVAPLHHKFTARYIAAAPRELNKKNLGEYTLQQIQEGKFTFQNAKKLNDFLDEYQKKNFTNEDEHLAWIADQLSQDTILATYFSPGHTCWPQFFTSNLDGSSSPVLDLELALLLNSTGVQKYAGDDLAAFCTLIIKRSKESDEPLLWMDQVKQRLNLFNDPVIQAYLDENKITVEKLIKHSRTTDDGVCLDENLKSPLVKQYFDEGFFCDPNEKGAIRYVIQRCGMTENFSFLLHSPVIRIAYKTGVITNKNIGALGAYKPSYPRDILVYLIEHILKDEKSQPLAGKFLDYFEQKLKRLGRWSPLQPLTEEQKADLAMKGVKEAIIDGELTMKDVLEHSWTFLGWRTAMWLK